MWKHNWKGQSVGRRRPETVQEFFDFYYEDFKPLYSHLQSLNEPPVEMFFEVNAALDHLSRHWHYGQEESDAVRSATAHLKRGCFDAFKIVVRDALDKYQELKGIDTSIIDNGRFDGDMRRLVHRIREGATRARLAEGNSRDCQRWHEAYELWEPVYVDCIHLEEQFYLSPKVEWARKKQTRRRWRDIGIAFAVGVLASLAAWSITELV